MSLSKVTTHQASVERFVVTAEVITQSPYQIPI